MNALKREIKPNISSYRKKLGPAIVCLDDVRDIFDAVTDFTHNKSTDTNEDSKLKPVQIVAGNAVADSPEDLKDATQEELQRVSIISRFPRISVDLWNRHAEVVVDSEDLPSRAFADGIADFVDSRRINPIFHIFRLSDIFMPALFITLLAYSLWDGEKEALTNYTNYVAYGTVIASFLFALESRLYTLYAYGSVKVEPVWRSEDRRIRSQTKSNILVAVGAAIVGAAIASVAGLWQGWFVK
ncbi:hypothetical protein [Streptosporangium sp. NPDC004631]